MHNTSSREDFSLLYPKKHEDATEARTAFYSTIWVEIGKEAKVVVVEVEVEDEVAKTQVKKKRKTYPVSEEETPVAFSLFEKAKKGRIKKIL